MFDRIVLSEEAIREIIPEEKKITFPFRNGDRVLFWGDSITDNAHWAISLETWVRCRYPRWRLDFINLGWGGDKTSNWNRLERDLDCFKTFKPTLVFIKLGMNDGEYKEFSDETCNIYLQGIKNILDIFKKRGNPRVILSTPTAYESDVVTPNNKVIRSYYVETLRKMSDRLMILAREKKIPVLDLNLFYNNAMMAYKRLDAELKFSGDAVHPAVTGNALICWLMLISMRADGRISSFEFDVSTGERLRVTGQKLTSIKKEESGFAMKRVLQSFPFITRLEEDLSVDPRPWYDILNCHFLRITGLKSKYCKLVFENKLMGVFSREECEKGINTASLPLPEKRSARFLQETVFERHQARYKLWREILLSHVKSPLKFDPPNKENYISLLLRKKIDLLISFLNSKRICPEGKKIRIEPQDTADAFEGAQIKVEAPFPESDEVQILFRVDTNEWRGVKNAKGDAFSFLPPLKLKGEFNNWQLVDMIEEPSKKTIPSGIWTCRLNLPRLGSPLIFAFDDAGERYAGFESQLSELVKNGLGQLPGLGHMAHPSFVPDDHKCVEITSEKLIEAVKQGYIIRE